MITSRQNSIIKKFRNSDKSVFTVEGAKLVREALNAGFTPLHILAVEKCEFELVDDNITAELAEYISDTKTPQGVFAMFERPASKCSHFPADVTANKQCLCLCLLDGVQEPGNVGAIIRSCEAFGFDGVILSENSADVFSPKVIRASAGSVFRLPCTRANLSDAITRLKQEGVTVWGAALDENATPLERAEFPGKNAVVIGNEGRGISAEILNLCDYRLYIPIKGAESLNAAVAAGIICYEIRASLKTFFRRVPSENFVGQGNPTSQGFVPCEEG